MKRFLLLISSFVLGLAQANSQDYFDKLEKEEKSQNKIVYWQYGYPDFDRAFASEKVANHYGFSFNQVAGCVVTDKLVARIRKHNNRIEKILVKKIGTDWRDKVYYAIDSVYRIDTILLNHFYNDTSLYSTLSKWTDTIKEPYECRVSPQIRPGIYMINAFIIDKEWKVTNRSILKVEATYPNITFRILSQDQKQLITSTYP